MQAPFHLWGLALDCITCGFPLKLSGNLKQHELDYADADLLSGHSYLNILFKICILLELLHDTIPRQLISSWYFFCISCISSFAAETVCFKSYNTHKY